MEPTELVELPADSTRLRATARSVAVVGIFGLVLGSLHLNSRILITHDYIFHVLRYVGTAHAWASCQLVPQLDPAAYGGFGYAVNLFYPPLSAYWATLFHFIVRNWNLAINLAAITTIIGSGITMYFFGRALARSEAGGLIAAICYMGAPYLLVNSTVRFAAGESLAMVFAPIMFLGTWRILNGRTGWLVLGLGAAGTLLSHSLSAVIFASFGALFVVGYLIMSRPMVAAMGWRRIFGQLALAVLIALGLGAFFVLPLFEARATAAYNVFEPGFMIDMSRVSLNTHQYFTAAFISENHPPYGWIGLMGVATCVFAAVAMPRLAAAHRRYLGLGLGLSAAALFMTTAFFPWAAMPEALLMIQFPWRLNVVITFFLASSAGVVFSVVPRIRASTPDGAVSRQDAASRSGSLVCDSLRTRSKLAVAGVGAVVLVSAGMVFSDQNLHYENAYSLIDVWSRQVWNAEYLPLAASNYVPLTEGFWDSFHTVGQRFVRPDGPVALSGDIAVVEFSQGGRELEFRAEVEAPGVVELPVVFYPGWRADVDGAPVPVFESMNGFAAITLDTPGIVQVKARYAMSPATRFGSVISAVTIIALCGYAAVTARRRQRVL